METALRLYLITATVALTLAPAFASAQAPNLDALRAAARASRNDAGAQHAYGMAALRAGQNAAASAALEAAARLQPGNESAAFEAARPSFNGTDYRAAQRACRRVERIERNGVWARVCRARAFLVWNRSARAFEEITEALEVDPNNYEALVALGDAHRLRLNRSESESAYAHATRAEPRRIEAIRGLGLLYLAARDLPLAERHLRAAIQIDPYDPEGLVALAQLVTGDERRQLLETAVSVRPGWAEARTALGDALIEADRGPAARVHFEAAIATNDRLAVAHCGLGRVLTAAGEYEDARAAIDRALEIVPNYATAAIALAELHRAQGRAEPAFEQYRRAAGLDPRDPGPLLSAAELALERNRDVLAAGFLDRLLARHGELARALALYGDVMVARSERPQAREYYQRALRGEGPLERERVQSALSGL
jgi:tetratricopeptide (TPR) repeat protein